MRKIVVGSVTSREAPVTTMIRAESPEVMDVEAVVKTETHKIVIPGANVIRSRGLHGDTGLEEVLFIKITLDKERTSNGDDRTSRRMIGIAEAIGVGGTNRGAKDELAGLAILITILGVLSVDGGVENEGPRR